MFNNNASLINFLQQFGYLQTPLYIEAFKKNKREDFVRVENKDMAYGNFPLEIGAGQTISQPATVAFMLEKLSSQPGDKVLDIGAGSGWQTALLAYIVGSQGKVIGIELIPELVKFANSNLAKYNYHWAKVIEADGSKGYDDEALFDRIVLAAAAQTNIPPILIEQLKPGGRLLAPLGGSRQSLLLLEKTNNHQLIQQEFPGFVFVPLIESSNS